MSVARKRGSKTLKRRGEADFVPDTWVLDNLHGRKVAEPEPLADRTFEQAEDVQYVPLCEDPPDLFPPCLRTGERNHTPLISEPPDPGEAKYRGRISERNKQLIAKAMAGRR